jgi:hypothetical protein
LALEPSWLEAQGLVVAWTSGVFAAAVDEPVEDSDSAGCVRFADELAPDYVAVPKLA